MTLLNANVSQATRQHIVSARETIKSVFRIAHTRLECSNGNECDVYESFKKMFPKWGDKHRSNENDVFSNTCTVDRWLALVYIIVNSRPQLFSGIIDKYFGESSDLMAILGLAQKCDYGVAKFNLARLNNLNVYK